MKTTALAALTTVLGLALAAPAGAAEDPERNGAAPTGWHWWHGQTPAQIDQREEDAGERVISISPDNSWATRFSVALVRNEGSYARDGGWFHDKTGGQVLALTKEEGRRLVDLEPYWRLGAGVRFAGVTVANKGEAKKSWRWNYDLTAAQVKADIDEYKLRLIDLSAYQDGGKRRFAYVAVRNKGEDARAWWWYHGVSREFVQARAEEHKARVVDIGRDGAGKVAAVLVRNKSVFSTHAAGVTATELSRHLASNGMRITSLERNGGRFWATMIDNAEPESGRVRSIIRSGLWRDTWFGAFSKRVGGKTYVGLAHNDLYQPMSVLKLVPYLYAMDQIDMNKAGFGDLIVSESPKGQDDQHVCPGQVGERTRHANDTLKDVLQRAMWQSQGRAHESLLNRWTPEAITARMHQLGLSRTTIHYGCQHPGKNLWLSNRTTLSDMGELFEGVDVGSFFPKQGAKIRKAFYDNMGSGVPNSLRAVVASEAALAGKSAILEDFMSKVSFHSKGGGVTWGVEDGVWRYGRALSYRLTLPFKGTPVRRGAGPEKRAFIGGFFADGIEGPCDEWPLKTEPSSVDAACRKWGKTMDAAWDAATAEPQRLPIREALATW